MYPAVGPYLSIRWLCTVFHGVLVQAYWYFIVGLVLLSIGPMTFSSRLNAS